MVICYSQKSLSLQPGCKRAHLDTLIHASDSVSKSAGSGSAEAGQKICRVMAAANTAATSSKKGYTLEMNFLAHLHLATLADSSLLGNLLADFVRGNPQDEYAPEIVAGIMMHRRVDVMTDTQPLVKEARRYFSADYRRVAPITLDVLWDHFLARNWDKLMPDCTLPVFIQHAQSQIVPHLHQTPARFQNLNTYLWPERWLERYAELPFIADVLQGMANRRPKLAALAGSFQDIEQHYQPLEQLFWAFYPAMMSQAQRQQI
ncbi:acyl carrier protein phosphodiesterase [Yersinia intermedia]|nr:acyl carrier protein phosphodiesterase [Yersinia intermedia]